MLGTSSETGTKERIGIGFASHKLLLVSLAIDNASAIGDARLDRLYRMKRLHFLGRSKRALGRLGSFLDLGPKSSSRSTTAGLVSGSPILKAAETLELLIRSWRGFTQAVA